MGGGCWQGLECYIVCVAAGLEVMNILGSNPWIPGSWVLTFSSNEQKVEFVKGDISLLKVAIAIN